MSNLRKLSFLCSVALVLAASPASAIVLHATDAENQGLYTIDTGTGYTVSLVGSYAIPAVENFIGGLAFDQDGVLYGCSAGIPAQLHILDPGNAATTPVGPLSAGFVFEGGLAFAPGSGTLYAVNQGNAGAPHLLTINKLTGQATDVGQIAGGDHDFAGLAFDATGQLYGLDRVTNALWRIDKSNPSGALTVQVGAGLGNGIVMGDVGGMTNDPATGTYYGYASDSRQLISVDLATGVGTVLHTFDAKDPVFYSLAYTAEKPVPANAKSWGALKSLYRK